MKRLLGLLILAFGLALPALAVSPDEMLADPVLEERARDISAGLRCLVCQNQSIDDSDADLARDLRILVRERLVAGDSDAEVEQYLVDRYGEYVLLNPRLNLHTIMLWIAAPILLIAGLAALWCAAPILLIAGLAALWWAARRRTIAMSPQGLTEAERALLDDLERKQEDR